jgi:hypothetical protein
VERWRGDELKIYALSNQSLAASGSHSHHSQVNKAFRPHPLLSTAALSLDISKNPHRTARPNFIDFPYSHQAQLSIHLYACARYISPCSLSRSLLLYHPRKCSSVQHTFLPLLSPRSASHRQQCEQKSADADHKVIM